MDNKSSFQITLTLFFLDLLQGILETIACLLRRQDTLVNMYYVLM